MEQGAECNHNAAKAQGADDPGLMVPEHQPPGREQKCQGQQVDAIAEEPLGQLPQQVQRRRMHANDAQQQKQRQEGKHQGRNDPPGEGGLGLLRQDLRGFLFGFCPCPLGGGFAGGRLGGGSFRHEDASRRKE